jgi:hypothetical protein
MDAITHSLGRRAVIDHDIPLVAVAKGVNFLRRDRHSFSTAERAKRLLSGEFGLTNKI